MADIQNNQERAAGTVGVSDEALLKTWLACKSIDNRQFCVEFGRAVLTLVDHSSAMEKIAQQWDGCFCEIASVGQVDIGAAIRSDWEQYNHLAATSTTPADEGAAVKEVHMPHRCIKPHCPADCSGCNHTISGRDEARNLICDMLDEFANDGHGATFEDGEHPLVDRARAYLFRANAEFEPLYATPQPPTAEPVDPAYPFYELKFIMRVLSHKGGAPKQDWDTAYGMAREIFSRWHKDRQSTAEGQTKQGRAADGAVSDEQVDAAMEGFHFTATGLPRRADMRCALEQFAATQPPSASPVAVPDMPDLQWLHLPEIFAKFIDYAKDPTDANAQRIITAASERFATSKATS
jgi:hypothetical protein